MATESTHFNISCVIFLISVTHKVVSHVVPFKRNKKSIIVFRYTFQFTVCFCSPYCVTILVTRMVDANKLKLSSYIKRIINTVPSRVIPRSLSTFFGNVFGPSLKLCMLYGSFWLNRYWSAKHRNGLTDSCIMNGIKFTNAFCWRLLWLSFCWIYMSRFYLGI